MSSRNKNVLQVMTFLVTGMVVTQANRAVMNPLHPIDSQVSEEISSDKLKPESRMPPTTSEVMALLAEDETRQGNSSSKHPGGPTPDSARMDCSKITMQIFQVLLQNPDTVEPEDYSCGLLNLISHFEKSNGRMRALEASLHSATSTIKTLESSLQTEMSKTQFLIKELNETVHKETERAIKAENVIARRVLSEKSRVDFVQKNLTDLLETSMEQLKEFEGALKQMDQTKSSSPPPNEKGDTTPYHPALALPSPLQPTQTSPSVNEQDIQKIEVKISSLQQFIQDLSNRVTNMEGGSEEHVNKGIAQIFKTYASLANEIEKETERATGEETTLKTLITTEIATVAKQIATLQDRITEEKNRVQIIENRRTADLFEEINRAKSEESRLGQKLKDEMSKAAAAFKRLEQHVDTQLNSTKGFDDDFKSLTDSTTRRVGEVEEKLTEQIRSEHARALSMENSLMTRVDAETQRAMVAENEMKVLYAEERDRSRSAQHELKVAIDTEIYRAKGVEFSISGLITAETERSKQEEFQMHEYINANMSRLLTDIIKEFTRAQNAEMELLGKINNEISRATSAEQSLLDNVNSELTRATDKEQDLFNLIKKQENSPKIVDECRNWIETEASRARTAESNLEIQIQGEVMRAKDREEKMSVLMQEGLDRVKAVEVNVTQTTSEKLRHLMELELEVRKTVMAEVARAVDAENGLKQQIFSEVERARSAELALSQGQGGNYSEISNKMQELIHEVEKDSLRLEDISLQISRNLTGDILTLAELFDDKLDDLERSENVRLKKIEDDMKKCCTGSSWRWRSPKGKSASGSAAGTVINKLMQVFGAINDDPEGSSSTSPSPTTVKKRSGKGNNRKADNYNRRSLESTDNSPITESDQSLNMTTSFQAPADKEISQLKVPTKIVDQATNETVVYIHALPITEKDDIAAELPEKIKVPRKISVRSSRRAGNSINTNNTSSNRTVVSVQSANSKVTSKYG